ncbi:MAG TPA: hypothetical protein VG733_07770 [Chthoniobacteraceae bacterium]|nr:hypothetical protein [Chthoniobacteraceae bacterium]
MKLFTAAFFLVSLVLLRPLAAQDANAVPVPGESPAPGQPPAPSLFPNENPPPIVNKQPHTSGNNTPPGDTSYNPFAKNKGQNLTVENVANNIAYRKAKTKALRDAKVQEAQAGVDAAKTYPDKRVALRHYYAVLADKILKIDGSIKKLVDERLKASLKDLDDSKVNPKDRPPSGEL